MKRIALLVALVLGFAVGHATAQEVTYNFDRDTDFSKFLTYKWVDIKSVRQVDYITTQQIAHVIDAELAKKGLLKTDSDYADLYIGYQTALNRQTLWMPYQDGWGYGPGWDGGLATLADASIHAGQLDLDMYAAAEKKLVWRGAVSKAFDLTLNLDRSETKIQESVEKMLTNYPPKRSQSADRQRELNDHRRNGSLLIAFSAPSRPHLLCSTFARRRIAKLLVLDCAIRPKAAICAEVDSVRSPPCFALTETCLARSRGSPTCLRPSMMQGISSQ